MKKVLLLTIIFILILTAGCGSKELTANDYVTKLQAAGLPIGDIIVYTAETDINELLGRPNGYTSKVNFADTTLEQLDKESPAGGSIEVFEKKEDAVNRKEYIDGIGKAMQVLGEYSYIKGGVLLRLDKSLTPDQAEKYKTEFEKIK